MRLKSTTVASESRLASRTSARVAELGAPARRRDDDQSGAPHDAADVRVPHVQHAKRARVHPDLRCVMASDRATATDGSTTSTPLTSKPKAAA